MDDSIRLTVLGAGGSVPVDGERRREFGGATSCYLLEAAGETVFLDAGTGLRNAPARALQGRRFSLLLSHPHADHLLGLPFFPPLCRSDAEVRIYARERNGLSAAGQIGAFLSPPLWPCTLADYPARTQCVDAADSFDLGRLRVDTMEAPHPGGSTVYRLSLAGKSVVYATDFEHTGDAAARLAAFARGTDLLLYDGHYTREEYDRHRGYGHSTAETGLWALSESGAGRLVLIHHNPDHTDDVLRDRENALGTDRASFARQGEEILL